MKGKITADDGFFFGIGAFETIGVEGGRLAFMKEHMDRLEEAADFFGLTFSRARLEDKGAAVLDKFFENMSREEIELSRLAMKITISPDNELISLRENPYREEDYACGMRTALSPVMRNETSPFTFRKTLLYGDLIHEKRRMKKEDIQEPIFVNSRGELTEGAVSNIFFIRDREIYTPPLICGLLPGIIRKVLCRTYKVKEKVIRPEEVGDYQEMFLTNSLMEIMPVYRMGDHIFTSREETLLIQDDYRVRKRELREGLRSSIEGLADYPWKY